MSGENNPDFLPLGDFLFLFLIFFSQMGFGVWEYLWDFCSQGGVLAKFGVFPSRGVMTIPQISVQG